VEEREGKYFQEVTLKEVVAVSFKMKESLLEKNSKDFLLICKTNQLKKKI
jgi:hypothetical protein